MTTQRRMTVPRFVAAKATGEKLSMVTAYDFSWAQIMDEAGVDSILVGDSLGMVVQGKSSTVPVTLDEIIYHGEMVARAVQHALVIVDLPFMTYQISPHQALESAGRIIKETGAQAVKLEGGEKQAATIRAIAEADIPVMAHVGMQPQSISKLGGHGRIQRDVDRILADAKAAEEAGAFSIVIELVPRQIAAEVSAAVSIPTIGIGAGPDCDGQVLVTHDLLGISPSSFQPKFLKRYADLRSIAKEAVRQYADDVRSGAFPDAEHSHE